MRLKSCFKDYYDGLAANDLEPEPLYIRKTESCKGIAMIPTIQIYGRYGSKLMDTAVIGFCGRLYPVIKHTTQPKYCPVTRTYEGKTLSTFYYDAAAYLSAHILDGPMDKSDTDKIIAFFNLATIDWRGAKTDYSPPLLNYFTHYKTPIFVTWHDNGNNVSVSPRLASWDFARIVPPYQAWRDLTVYLSNLAHPNPIIPTISNADMIVAKGFNHPDSFRAIKGESGPARKRRKK